MKTGQAETPYTEFINKMVKDAQENPYWKREYMDAMMDAVHQDKEIRKAEAKGAHDKAVETARAMLINGKLSVEEISDITQLSAEEIKELQ